MKKLYLTALILLTLSSLTFAQDYNINSYKYRYQKFKGFTLNPTFGSYGNQEFNNEDNQNTPNRDFVNRNSFSGNLNLQGSYFSTVNVETLQQSIRLNVGSRLNWSYTKNISSVNGLSNNRGSNIYNNLNTNYRKTTRHYYEANRFKYRELSGGFSSYVQRTTFGNTNILVNRQLDKLQNINANFNASFGRGNGRIDYVTDVVQAHFILEDLRTKKGINYTNDQLELVAQGITFIRNQRYLDFRFRTIDQLTMLDSFMNEAGIQSEKDIKYFTTLNDNWLYGTNLNRNSGKRWTYYYTPGITIFGEREKDLREQNYGDTIQYNSYEILYTNQQTLTSDFAIEYTHTKQKSWKVQQSFFTSFRIGAGLSAFHGRGTQNDSAFVIPEREDFNPRYEARPRATVSATWQHLYQPNSRTFYIASISPQISTFDVRNNEVTGSEWTYFTNSITPRVLLNFNYYKWFNPQIALNLRAGAQVSHSRTNFPPNGPNKAYNFYETDISHSVTVGLTYQLY